MSKTRKDKPSKFKTKEDNTNYKQHGGLMARNFAGPGGVKCQCCKIDDDSYKKTDRQLGKKEITKQLDAKNDT